jgi:hypothetical protein
MVPAVRELVEPDFHVYPVGAIHLKVSDLRDGRRSSSCPPASMQVARTLQVDRMPENFRVRKLCDTTRTTKFECIRCGGLIGRFLASPKRSWLP